MTKLSFGSAKLSGNRALSGAVFAAYNKKIADEINHRLRLSLGAPPLETLSEQQAAAIDFVRHGEGNAILVAVAGAGKTTTLIEICKALGTSVRAATFHSLGFAAWRDSAMGVKVENDKTEKLMEQQGTPTFLRTFVRSLVSLGKQSGVGCVLDGRLNDGRNTQVWFDLIDHYDLMGKLAMDELSMSQEEVLDQAIFWTRKIMRFSVQTNTDWIDYDDMLFAPLFHNARIPKYQWVLGDEWQDTNATRREFARRMMGEGSRFIGVGDPHQAIYGFTGADSDALDITARELSCTELPLTVTYRCPRAVVAHAQRWVSHIQAHPSAPEGSVRQLHQKSFFVDLSDGNLILRPTDAILCRLTKPIVALAFDLIRRRIPCHVEGREIGKGLIELSRKWKRPKTIGQLRLKLEDYREREVERLLSAGKEVQAESINDKVETLLVIMDTFADDEPVASLKETIEGLFKDTEGNDAPTVTLSTVHKAKGREWDRVFLWGRNAFMPSKFAKQPWQVQQEKNLIYVAVTRAKMDLVEIVVEA